MLIKESDIAMVVKKVLKEMACDTTIDLTFLKDFTFRLHDLMTNYNRFWKTQTREYSDFFQIALSVDELRDEYLKKSVSVCFDMDDKYNKLFGGGYEEYLGDKMKMKKFSTELNNFHTVVMKDLENFKKQNKIGKLKISKN